MKFRFYDYTQAELAFKPVFILGACRSGKSSLGRLLGSLRHVFHVEEDWLLLMLPLLRRCGMIKEDVFVSMLRAWVSEMAYDVMLMRRGSFRPSDHSYLRRMKTDSEIAFSLKKLRSRADVERYAAKHHPRLVFNLAELNGFADLLKKAYPKARFILVEREEAELAADIAKKGWFDAKSLRRPGNHQVFRPKGGVYFPFWVPEKEGARFLKMDSAERAAFYARRQNLLTRSSLKKAGKLDLERVDYKELLKQPEKVLARVLPGAQRGGKTASLLKELRSR